jgi:hypothetical protein
MIVANLRARIAGYGFAIVFGSLPGARSAPRADSALYSR